MYLAFCQTLIYYINVRGISIYIIGGETMKSNFYIEYYGKQIEEADLIKKAKAIWTKSGKKVADLTSLNLYVKPEENMAYYVFNDDETGNFSIEE